MENFIIFIIINLFCFSEEAILLPLYEKTSISYSKDYYLDTSIYKPSDYINFTIKFTSKAYGPNFLYSSFSDFLDFSGLSRTSGQCKRTGISAKTNYEEFIHKCNYTLRMDYNYNYLLLRWTYSSSQFLNLYIQILHHVKQFI